MIFHDVVNFELVRKFLPGAKVKYFLACRHVFTIVQPVLCDKKSENLRKRTVLNPVAYPERPLTVNMPTKPASEIIASCRLIIGI
jgi:hypothetical protein